MRVIAGSAKGHHLKELYVVDENGLENYIGDLSKIHHKGTTRAMKDHIAELTIAAEQALDNTANTRVFSKHFADEEKTPLTKRSPAGVGAKHGHKAIVRDCCKQLAICRRVSKAKKHSKK